MSEKHSHIDQQLQNKFTEFAPMPPISWEQMEVALDNRKESKRRKLVFGWVAAAAIVSAVSVIALFNHESANTKTATGSELTHAQTSSSNPSKIESPLMSEKMPLMDVQEGQKAVQKVAASTFKTRKVNSIVSHEELIQTEKPENGQPMSEYATVFSDGPFSRNIRVSLSNFDPKSLDLPMLQPQKIMRKQLSKWSFEVGYDQNQTAMMYRTNADYSQYVHKNYLQHMKESEFALSASQVHAALRYQLSHNWILSAGWSWMQNRTQQNFRFKDSMPASVSQGFKSDAYGNYPIFGYMGIGPEINYSGISNISMLSLPVSLIFEKEIKKGWKFSAEGLIQSNYLTAKKGQTLNYHYLTLQDIGGNTYRNWVFSAKVGAGIQKEMSNRTSIGVRLNSQGMLNSLYKSNSAIENRGWSVGLSAIYIWRLY